MVLGDSVTFGTGVDDEETYSNQLAGLLNERFNVQNYGTGGWAFAEYYLAYKKYVEENDPALVIMGVFPGNDFAELRYSKWKGKKDGMLPVPPLEREDKYIDKDGVVRGGSYLYEIPVLRNMAVFVFVAKTIVEPFLRFLGTLHAEYLSSLPTEDIALNTIAEISRNSKLLVLLFAAQYHYPDLYSPDEFLGRLKSLDGIEILNFYPLLSDKYKDLYLDGSHFTKEGNEIVAQEVLKYINAKGLL